MHGWSPGRVVGPHEGGEGGEDVQHLAAGPTEGGTQENGGRADASVLFKGGPQLR